MMFNDNDHMVLKSTCTYSSQFMNEWIQRVLSGITSSLELPMDNMQCRLAGIRYMCVLHTQTGTVGGKRSM